MTRKPKLYRDFIDELARICRDGQGQVGPRRARVGVWNGNASENSLPDQHAINVLLAGLDANQRALIATLLAGAFEGGVFETLKTLEQFEIEPFLNGYEGSAFHDFIGRLADWEWPTAR